LIHWISVDRLNEESADGKAEKKKEAKQVKKKRISKGAGRRDSSRDAPAQAFRPSAAPAYSLCLFYIKKSEHV